MSENETNPIDEELDDNSAAIKPRPLRDDTEMDITPMIDITFLLLIFFIVCGNQNASKIALPQARFGQGVSEKQSIVITAQSQGPEKDCLVILGQEKIADGEQQTARIPEYIEQTLQEGKKLPQVMLMGAKDIKAKDLKRISTAIGKVEGVQLYLGVDNVK